MVWGVMQTRAGSGPKSDGTCSKFLSASCVTPGRPFERATHDGVVSGRGDVDGAVLSD